MEGMDFEIRGLEELRHDMNEMIGMYPDELNKAMRRVNAGFRKEVNENIRIKHPVEREYRNKTTKKGKKKIYHSGDSFKKWRTQNTFGELGIITESRITNKAPHWHLYENGHAKYDFHGKPTGGFVPGAHIAEKVREKYREEFPALVDRAIDEVLKKAGL